MENRSYEVLEFHKVINKMIDLSKLEVTKEKFIDLDIIRNKGELDKELSLLVEFIDFYKYDDGLELAGLSNIEKYLKSGNIKIANNNQIQNSVPVRTVVNREKNETNTKTSTKPVANKVTKLKNIYFD